MTSRFDPDRTLYLVDGTNNLYRAFFAIRGLSTSKGQPTNAIYGFTSMLRKLIRESAPRYLVVAFDLAGPTFRHERYPEYKAHRPEVPDELVAQIPFVKMVCQVLGVPILEMQGYEADDVIATLAERGRRAGLQVVIVATDKDLLQLVDDGIVVYNPVSEEFLDSDGVERTFGVRPAHVLDVLALAGDDTDNIPGVPGIGMKGAKDLVRRYGDLEAVLRSAAEIPGKRAREGLLGHAGEARLSRELATVRRDVPIAFDPEALRLKPADASAAAGLFLDLEFMTLAREFAAPVAALSERPATLVRTRAELERTVRRLRAAGTFALNLEREPYDPMRARIVGIALATSEETFYVPVAHGTLGAASEFDAGEALAALRPALADPGLRRTGHNIKSDLIVLRRLGLGDAAFDFDTMLASYLLNASRRSHGLDAVAQDVAGVSVPSYESILGSGARRTPLDAVEPERAATVVAARAGAVQALRERLNAQLEEDGLLPLFRDVEMPLASILADMEKTGVRVDTDFLGALSADWEKRLADLTARLHAMAGREFNINSPRQIGEILFETLKLRPGKRTVKTRSFSTSVEVLEELAESHDLPRLLLEYRELHKLKSTYVDTLPRLIHPETGRVHTSFNQAVAATGRLSSSDPNLQNIPIRTELGRGIRRAFVTDPGWVLLAADYSQIELRILAHLCGDPALIAAFRSGEDIHRRTAAEVFGVMPELVSAEMRRRAKVVNFGLLYGMGPQRLAREQGIPLKEAEAFIERYFERLPRVKEYLDGAVAAAEREARVATLFRRLRYFPEIRGVDRNARQQALRAAVNSAIQGTAADLIKMAMVALARTLAEAGTRARMTLQVHDELVLETPVEDLGRVAPLVRAVMQDVHVLEVPLVADLRSGPNWLEMTPLAAPAS